MLSIDNRSRVPIYEQIMNQILELIMVGVFKPHDQLPSIRSLAQSLKLNVNTVKRAFSDLEAARVIYTISGRGSFVSEQAPENSVLTEKAREELEVALRSGRSKGLSREDVQIILDKIFSEEW